MEAISLSQRSKVMGIQEDKVNGVNTVNTETKTSQNLYFLLVEEKKPNARIETLLIKIESLFVDVAHKNAPL